MYIRRHIRTHRHSNSLRDDAVIKPLKGDEEEKMFGLLLLLLLSLSWFRTPLTRNVKTQTGSRDLPT